MAEVQKELFRGCSPVPWTTQGWPIQQVSWASLSMPKKVIFTQPHMLLPHIPPFFFWPFQSGMRQDIHRDFWIKA